MRIRLQYLKKKKYNCYRKTRIRRISGHTEIILILFYTVSVNFCGMIIYVNKNDRQAGVDPMYPLSKQKSNDVLVIHIST